MENQHKGIKQEKKEGAKDKYKTARKQSAGISKSLPISDYFKCECIKFSNQKS